MSQMTKQQLYTNDGYTLAANDRTLETINPAIGEVLMTAQAVGREDVDCTVKSTQYEQKIWTATTAMECSYILRRTVNPLCWRNDELVRLETLDTGKPLSETATVDIIAGTDVLEYYADSIPALKGSQVPLRDSSSVYTRREPLGVVAGINAQNYPIQIVPWKSAPALTTSNVMTFKLSEVTPLTAPELTGIRNEADLPDGAFNVLLGIGMETGQCLIEHLDITRVLFTDDVASGKKVVANFAASSLKEVIMELSGESSLIIADDTDLDLTADIAMMASFYSSDQVYTNDTRVFTLAKWKAESEHKVLERVSRVRPGDLSTDDTSFDPLISSPHRDNVLCYIEGGRHEGARLLCGGEALKDDGFDNDTWIALTVFTDCNNKIIIVREEIFGPVMSALSYTDEAEAIRRANAAEYGLAADVVTPNLNHAHRPIHQLEAGICWINSWGESPAEVLIGDYKHSGTGRENGVMTLQSCTQVKSIRIGTNKFQSIF